MDKYNVTMVFSSGDPQTVARLTVHEMPAQHAGAAAEAVTRAVGDGRGFTFDDLLEVTATRDEPGVAGNLLAQYVTNDTSW